MNTEINKNDKVTATNKYGEKTTGTVLSKRGSTITILTTAQGYNRSQTWHISKVQKV